MQYREPYCNKHIVSRMVRLSKNPVLIRSKISKWP